jgi:hypothetical protein
MLGGARFRGRRAGEYGRTRIPEAGSTRYSSRPTRVRYRSPTTGELFYFFRHPDDWLFDNRWVMVWVWLALVLVILLVPAVPSGLRASSPYVQSALPTVTDRATLLLALGTFALANAALLQAVSAERSRRFQMTPGLEVRAAVSAASVGIPMPAGAEAAYLPPAGSITPYLTNHGPGAAVGMRVRYAVGLTPRSEFEAYSRWPLFSNEYRDFDRREDAEPLAVGQYRPLPILEEISRGIGPFDFNDAASNVITQVVVECRCLDAEGHPGMSAFLGLKRAIPSEAPGVSSPPGGNLPAHNFNNWTVMDAPDVEFLLLNLAYSMRWGSPRPLTFGRHTSESA